MLLIATLAFFGALTAVVASSGPSPVMLRADGTNLLDGALPQYALDSGRPLFEWTPTASDATRDMRQKSFSLVLREVAYPAVAPIWSVGPVESDDPSFRFNETSPLKSGTLYEWAVSTVSTDGVTEVASALSSFARSAPPLLSNRLYLSDRLVIIAYVCDVFVGAVVPHVPRQVPYFAPSGLK
jgi:hypothetical protein